MITVRALPRYPIWHVESDNRWELAMTFLRMQEWYESTNPTFKGQPFLLEAYMDWYVREFGGKKGSFTYPTDWSAFNVPKRAVLSVFEGFSQISAKEQWLFRQLIDRGAFSIENFYLIGTRNGDKISFEHEYRHALFALNERYKEEISLVVDQYEVPELREWILKFYAPEVLKDEVQAYGLTGWPSRLKVLTEDMRSLRRALQSVERKYIAPRKSRPTSQV